MVVREVKWSLRADRSCIETTAEFLARGRRRFEEQTRGKPKEEVDQLRADLNAWREEYRAECAKDDIDGGDRYKVMKKLIVQLETIVRTASCTPGTSLT